MSGESTATSPRRAAPPDGVYRVLVLHAPGGARSGQSKVLERALLLSREESAEGGAGEPERLVLDDQEVSRSHALLSRADGRQGVVLRDAGSHNGTYVNLQRVDHAELASGDVIRAGQHVLLLQHLDHAQAQRLTRRRQPDSPFVGDSPLWKDIDEQLLACAREPTPVLLLGESGTGKELAARQLHAWSGRSGPFVAVNCTALVESVADSELFGHVKGAFSGAIRTTQGLFADAHGGTLLLDELGDVPLALQAKLLRAIETGEVRQVGSSRARVVDTRVLAATNVELEAAVAQGRFRGDLYARLQRSVIQLPPLRARREDVLPLVRHFLQAAGSRQSITADAAEALVAHGWPYNVRELRNAVEAALRAAKGERFIDLPHLPPALSERFASRLGAPAPSPVARVPESADELRALLEQHAWNVTKLAALLGKDRKQVYRWCDAFGIDLRQRR